MITLSADWLRKRWPELEASGSISIPLSSWDDGDAFTLSELGPLSAPQLVNGRLSLDGRGESEALISVDLVGGDPGRVASRHTFTAPDGRTYLAKGRCIQNEQEREMPVDIIEVTGALEVRRSALLESYLLEDAAVATIGLGTGGCPLQV